MVNGHRNLKPSINGYIYMITPETGTLLLKFVLEIGTLVLSSSAFN